MWNFKFIKALITGCLFLLPTISWAKASAGAFAGEGSDGRLVPMTLQLTAIAACGLLEAVENAAASSDAGDPSFSFLLPNHQAAKGNDSHQMK